MGEMLQNELNISSKPWLLFYKCFLAETTNANQRLTDEHNNKEAMWVKGASWDK